MSMISRRMNCVRTQVRIRNNQADFWLRKFRAQPRRRPFLFFQQVDEMVMGRKF
jgi:hypothetical protein